MGYGNERRQSQWSAAAIHPTWIGGNRLAQCCFVADGACQVSIAARELGPLRKQACRESGPRAKVAAADVSGIHQVQPVAQRLRVILCAQGL
jgi:hypothetical protein